jgi:hypothetical protein
MFTRGSKSWLIFQKPLHVLTRSILERKFDLSSINKCNILPRIKISDRLKDFLKVVGKGIICFVHV